MSGTRRTTPSRTTKLKQLWRLVQESHAQPLTGTPAKPIAPAPGEASIMFLGHSSFLLGIGGRNLLVDPVFATRLILMRRQRRAGIVVPDLPPIDAVLLTHAHMDHLNRPTLRRVVRATRRLTGIGPIAIVPTGVEDLVKTLGFREVRTLEWWQSTTLAGLQITLTPCKHWGARMFTDTHRGYGGYVIEAGNQKIYHSGDTAYFPGFREIGQRLGPIDVALMPIGAYSPDSYRAVHTSPEEGLQGFLDVGAQSMIPMHFGTFRLGREPMEEPPVRLIAEGRRLGLEQHVRILAEGETMLLRPSVNTAKMGDLSLTTASKEP